MDDLRQKTLDMIDALHERFKDCKLAMLIDQETGLVFSKSSASPTSQSIVQQVGADAIEALKSPSAMAFRASANEPQLVSITRVRKRDVLVVIQDLRKGDDALVCLFSKSPSRSYLMEIASEIFQLPMTMEAA